MTHIPPSALWLSGRTMRWHTHPHLAGTGDRLDGHQARVAWIILESHPNPSLALLRAALTHDAGEATVGDLPASFKRDCPEVALEHRKSEEWNREATAGPWPDLLPVEEDWIRWADRLDAYLWSQHHGTDMSQIEWRIAREEIARLKRMLMA